MGREYRTAKSFGLAAGLLLVASSAQAAPLTFDCDAPANVVSSVKNLAQTIPAISGVIDPKRARADRMLPSTGAQIDSPDGKSTAGFLLTLPSPDAQEMDVTLIVQRGEETDSRKVGTVSVNAPIPFRLFIDQTGNATIFIHDQSWSSEFMRLIAGREQVFCGSGQFTISDLRFSD